jgi:uncharacterized protein YkwD
VNRFLLILISFAISQQILAQTNSTQFEQMEDEILVLVNQHRESLGLTPLKMNSIVREQSQLHSRSMANGTEKFSRNGFNNRTKIIRSKFGGNAFAENIAYGHMSAKSVVDGWLNSPGHKKNIEGNYTHIGVGVAQTSSGTLYYTQIFVHHITD